MALLCALAAGFLFRLTWPATFALTVASVAQVLAMNGLRMAVMAVGAAGKPPAWSDAYVHESTGTFLIAVLGLTLGEAALCRWWRDSREVWDLQAQRATREYNVHRLRRGPPKVTLAGPSGTSIVSNFLPSAL